AGSGPARHPLGPPDGRARGERRGRRRKRNRRRRMDGCPVSDEQLRHVGQDGDPLYRNRRYRERPLPQVPSTGASPERESHHVGSTPSINGVWTVTVLNSTQFTIPVNVTAAGTGGTVGSSPMSCSILRMSGTTLNAGPRTVVISNSHFELHVSAMDLFSIANATAFVYYGVIVQNPSLTIGANNYTWIQNSNVSNLHQGSLLQIRGGHLTGTDPTSFTIGTVNASPNFKVKVSDVVRFNPQGAATIAAGASPYLYTNDDGVAETVVLDGVRG